MKNAYYGDVNLNFPICGLVEYPGGIQIVRRSLLNYATVHHSHLRGGILLISKRSLNKLALLVRSSGIVWTSLITLTYGVNYPHNGKTAKKHLNTFLVSARREWGDFDYFWVLEFQHRGAVHFHVATTLPPPDTFQRTRLGQIWSRISQEGNWPYTQAEFFPYSHVYGDELKTRDACCSVHEFSKAWERIRKSDGMSRYMAKYAQKLTQKVVPVWYRNVGRFWASSQKVKLPKGRVEEGEEPWVRQVLWLKGRDVEHWDVLPKIVLC